MKKYLIDYPRMLERELELMKESALLASNKATILEYKRYSEIQNHSIPRIQRALSILRYTGLFLKKPLQNSNKAESCFKSTAFTTLIPNGHKESRNSLKPSKNEKYDSNQ